jgi:hypothetical protein
MGDFVARFLRKNPDARAVAITGYGHINDPAQFKQLFADNGIAARFVAAMNEGQKGSDNYNAQNSPFSALTRISNAVLDTAENGRRTGFIDLKDQGFDVEGIVHFQRSEVENEGKTGQAAVDLASDTVSVAVNDRQGSGQVPSTSFKVSYADSVTPKWQEYLRTNERKIFDFVMNNFDGLTNNQKALLAGELYTYAKTRGKTGMDGSIVDIQFVTGEEPYVIIKTVRAGGEGYDPVKYDYSGSTEEYEVSLATLHARHGLDALFGKDSVSMPQDKLIDIQASKPEAVPKLVDLLAQQKDPKKISITAEHDYGEIGLSIRDDQYARVQFISAEELAYTPREQAFREADEIIADFRLYGEMGMVAGFGLPWSARTLHAKTWEKLGFSNLERALGTHDWLAAKTENWIKDKVSSRYRARQLLGEVSDTRDQGFIVDILGAKKEMRSINTQESRAMLGSLDQYIGALDRAIQAVEEAKRSPLASRAESRERAEQALAKTKQGYQRLLELRQFIAEQNQFDQTAVTRQGTDALF